MSEMTEAERRYKARKIRGLINTGDKPKTMIEAADIQKVSRPTAYRILAELDAWESTKTLEQEVTDIDAQLRTMPHGKSWAQCDKSKWYLASGRLLLAYAQGEYDPKGDAIGLDPMCE